MYSGYQKEISEQMISNCNFQINKQLEEIKKMREEVNNNEIGKSRSHVGPVKDFESVMLKSTNNNKKFDKEIRLGARSALWENHLD